MAMKAYEVGKSYSELVLPQGVSLHFDGAGFTMIIGYNSPTQREISDIRKGTFHFGFFTVDNGGIYTVFGFGGAILRRSTQLFDCMLKISEDGKQNLQPIADGQGYSLTIIFTDSLKGTVKVIRYVGLGHSLSKMLHEYMQKAPVTTKEDVLYYSKQLQRYTTKELADKIFSVK